MASDPDRELDRGRRVRYRFSPLERRGVIAGWRGGQIASVAAGLIVDVLVLRARPSPAGVMLALVGLAAGLAVAFWPIRGRTGEQWLPLVTRWSWSALAGGRLQLAPGPTHGHLATVRPSPPDSGSNEVRAVTARLRAGGSRTVFDGLKVVGAPFGSESSTPELGMVLDSRTRTATAALVVGGHSFALLGSSDQDGRIAGWARVLSSMAREGSEVHRVQWIESCLPDDGGAVRRHTADHAVLGADSPAGRSYRELVDEAAPVTRRHQVLVTLSIRTGRSSRAGRSSGNGTTGSVASWLARWSSLHRALDGADVRVEGVLGPGALAREIGEASAALAIPQNRSFPPVGSGPPSGRPAVADPRGRHRSREAGGTTEPLAVAHGRRADVGRGAHRRNLARHLLDRRVAPGRRHARLPRARSCSPRSGVRSAWSWSRWPEPGRPPGGPGPDRGPGRRRAAEAWWLSGHGPPHRERKSVEERDVELADGHAQYRFSGYVTVTSDSPSGLATACAAAEQAAGQAGIELRLLYGAQDVAFACSLPLGGGCHEESRPRVPAHVATTRHLCAAYPLVSEAGLGPRGSAHRAGRARRLLRLRPVRSLPAGCGHQSRTWWCSVRSAGARAPS